VSLTHFYLAEDIVIDPPAIGNRPVDEDQIERTADRVEERLRRKGPEVTTDQVGVEVLARLAKLDEVAYMRFASVYKDFQELTDFERELGLRVKHLDALQRLCPLRCHINGCIKFM